MGFCVIITLLLSCNRSSCVSASSLFLDARDSVFSITYILKKSTDSDASYSNV